MLVWECLNCHTTMASKGKPRLCIKCRAGSLWMKLIYGVFNETPTPGHAAKRELPD